MSIIDITDTQPVILQDTWIALQCVFALIPGPLGIYAGHSSFSYTWQQLAEVVSNAMITLPNIGRFLFPTGNAVADGCEFVEIPPQPSFMMQNAHSVTAPEYSERTSRLSGTIDYADEKQAAT